MFTLSHTKMSVIALAKQVLDHYAIPYEYDTYSTTDGKTVHLITYEGDGPEEAYDELEDLAIKYNM